MKAKAACGKPRVETGVTVKEGKKTKRFEYKNFRAMEVILLAEA